MTGAFEPPRTPDDTELTSEEWEAVRRLRARSAPPQRAEEPAPAATPLEQPTEPAAVAQPPAAPEPVAAQEPAAPQEPLAAQEPLAPPEPVLAPEPIAPSPSAPEPERLSAAEPVQPAAPAAPAEPEPVAAAAPSAAGTTTSRSDTTLPAVIFLVVLALVAVVLATLTTLKVSDRHARTRAGTQAVAAAASGVSTVLSYNYKSLDADFTKAESLLTPSFRKTYEATTAKAVQPLAAKYKAVSTAQVTAAGVISAAPSKASVLVFVSQQVTNTQLAAPRLDRSRIVVDLVHQHGRWLIAKLSPV